MDLNPKRLSVAQERGLDVRMGNYREEDLPTADVYYFWPSNAERDTHFLINKLVNTKNFNGIIIAGGEITRQARNWLGERLNASQRSQILFMDRNDILDLVLTHKIPLPKDVVQNSESSVFEDDIPF